MTTISSNNFPKNKPILLENIITVLPTSSRLIFYIKGKLKPITWVYKKKQNRDMDMYKLILGFARLNKQKRLGIL